MTQDVGLDLPVAAQLSRRARQQPDTPALIVQHGSAYETVSFKVLDDESSALARGFASAGIVKGTRTILLVKPGRAFFAATFALLKVGAVPVLIDPGLGVRNLGPCIDQADPAAFIGSPKAHLARVLFGWGKRTLKTLVTAGTRLGWSGHTLEDLRAAGSKGPTCDGIASQPSDVAAILFTSGSTGPPKGAVYTHRVFMKQVEVLREIYGIRPGEIDLATFPLFALFGPALGMTALVPDMDFTRPAQVRPEKLVAAVREWKATHMFGSPALLDTLGRYGETSGVILPSLRRVICAGAPVRPAVLYRMTKMLSPFTQVFTPYGATEALPVASIGSNEILGETAAHTAQGQGICVGQPVGGIETAILKITDEPVAEWSEVLKLPLGEIGEIAVRGGVVTKEYFNRPEQTILAKISTSESGSVWHRMGDVGYFDAKGRLWMCGRKSHRVVTGKETLFTIPVEGIFNTHPKVKRTALVGIGPRGQQRPVLCVELEPSCCGRDEEALVRHELLDLGTRFPHTLSIKHILFPPTFPVDIRHNAKIFREKLAAWAEGKI